MTPSTRTDPGQPTTPPDAGVNGTHPPPPPDAGDEVEVGTPEYLRLNTRRAELIHKKNRDGLTDAEQAEYEHLDRVVAAAVARRCPPSRVLTTEQRALVFRLLGLPEEPRGQ